MSEGDKRSAQLVMVTGFVALYFIFKYHIDRISFNYNILLFIALSVGVGSLISSIIGDLIVKLWFKIAHVLGWINTRILLSLLFYLFLFPIALIARIFNKDALKIKKTNRSSIYVERNHQYTSKDLENPW